MYDWITHTHTHLAGRCPHECVYCSIQDLQKRFPNLPYSGPLRLKEKEFAVQYGTGKTIFVENCNDLFADAVPLAWIDRILDHCSAWPKNEYIFQTKNPHRLAAGIWVFPPRCLIGITVETNRDNDLGNAPSRPDRLRSFIHIDSEFKTFITIEPIMDFDLDEFVRLLIAAQPDFVNIGADSKGHGLPEPSFEKVIQLVDALKAAGIEVREKRNLERLGSSKQPA
jgi:DNA repair photolyase